MMQNDTKTKSACIGRRPLICLFCETVPPQITAQHFAEYDFVFIKRIDNLFQILEDRMPDIFISFKPTQSQPEMETLPLLIRRMWFEYDLLSPKVFGKINFILSQRQLKCYLVRSSKNLNIKNSMVEVITPQSFLLHHTHKLDIQFEYCFFLDQGLDNDPHIQTFHKQIWPNLSRLRTFCHARYHKLANPFVLGNENKLLFTAFSKLEPLMMAQPLVVQTIE